MYHVLFYNEYPEEFRSINKLAYKKVEYNKHMERLLKSVFYLKFQQQAM